MPGGSGYGIDSAFPLVQFAEPIGLTAPPGETNRLFVIEKPGRIVVVTNLLAPTRTVFLDITNRVFFEQESGLLGLAFHPQYASNGYFYVTYTFSTNGGFNGVHLRLARFQVSPQDPNQALAESEWPLITQFDGDPWHEGGGLQFGPDGYLYASFGDGGQFGIESVQHIDRDFFGGMLRIDVDKRAGSLAPNPYRGVIGDYAIPADNPFVGAIQFYGVPVDPSRARTEFYVVGLRNPWRFSFDPSTKLLYSNDTGGSLREEVNLIFKGVNYGWPFDEGSLTVTNAFGEAARPSELFPPIAEFGHETDMPGLGSAIAGGMLYRGSNVPALDGAYIFSDFWKGDIGVIRPSLSELLPTLKDLQTQIDALEEQSIAVASFLEAKQAEWENQWAKTDQSWMVLEPASFVSGNGTLLVEQSDHSLLAQGDLPWDEIYTVQARTDLSKITAVRLEMLADDRLPGGGPGRSSGGNVVLSEFEVLAAPLSDPSAGRSIPLTHPTADYSQSGWQIESVLDGDYATGWAIAPAMGRSHEAVFELGQPVEFQEGALLTFSLRQSFGFQVTLGRFRISISTASPPPPADLAVSFAEILRLPSAQRNPLQKQKIADFYRSIDPEVQSIRRQMAELRQKQIASLRQHTMPIEWIARVPGIASFGVHPGTGEILMADMLNGLIYRLTVQTNGVSEFPPDLKDTGLFSDLTQMIPNPGVVPYSLNVPFWSDSALKTRWFCLPDLNDTIAFSRDDNWTFPAGTVWVKHFELEITNGVPSSARRLETRVLVSHSYGVHGATYRWDSAGKAATVVPDQGLNETILLHDGEATRTQVWRYPSRSQCLQCHTKAAGYALGFNTVQLNRELSYGGTPQNQIEALSHAGYFSAPVTNRFTLSALADLTDSNVSIEYRVRSYLHANCVHCHQPTGPGRSLWDARITRPRDLAGLIDGAVVHGSPSREDRLIKAGSLEHSVMWQRLSQLNERHMPPLATSILNTPALSLLSSWITNQLPLFESFADWQDRHFPETFTLDREASADPDGDAGNNYFEYLIGTDPHRRSYGLKVFIERHENRTVLRFPRHANLSSELQYSENPSDPNSWRPVDAPGNQLFFPAASGEAVIEDFNGDAANRFYRVLVREP
ncbi:MAG: PQQ-dependent sugar dehydrogenase [Verrucomicrobiales bacterium]|nr:PQQ-dependent sugar dehydrogenase [Verrucomicrobiales bacterium]